MSQILQVLLFLGICMGPGYHFFAPMLGFESDELIYIAGYAILLLTVIFIALFTKKESTKEFKIKKRHPKRRR
jgi:hypothetical protein